MENKKVWLTAILFCSCGPKEIRTPDLRFAKALLYQLSYGPTISERAPHLRASTILPHSPVFATYLYFPNDGRRGVVRYFSSCSSNTPVPLRVPLWSVSPLTAFSIQTRKRRKSVAPSGVGVSTRGVTDRTCSVMLCIKLSDGVAV